MKRASIIVGLVLAQAVVFGSSSAFADDEPPPAAPAAPVTIQVATPAAPVADTPPPPRTTAPRTDLWKISLGPRIGYLASSGYDAFSENDVLPGFSIDAQFPIFSRGRFALGVGLGYTGGASTAKLRGYDAKMGAHALSVPIEGRYHFGLGAYGFARAAPGTTAVVGSVGDPSAPSELRDTQWVFSTDASVGAGILLGPRGADVANKRQVRIWLVPEVGYTFATTARFDLRPDREAKDALGTDERTALGGLNLSAFFWRLSLGTTF